MKKLFSILLAVVLCFTISISMFDHVSFLSEAKEKKPGTVNEATVEKVLKEMTLREKVGQLFMVEPGALGAGTSVNSKMKKNYKKYPVGGIILLGYNIKNPSQLKSFTKNIQKLGNKKIPNLITVDEEGGRVLRIGNNKNFSVKKYASMRSIGRTKSTKKATSAAKGIGTYLYKYGITGDLAPVADVNSNPKNQVIGDRSFGSGPGLVSKMVKAQVKGFHQAGVQCCLKHFPGHGNTTADTHLGTVAVNKTWKQMKKTEIPPFSAGIKSGADMVMVAHIVCKKVTKNNLPATLSKKMITDKLRNELGFQGVVITDSMGMGAISQHYSSKKAAIKAIKAGADIVLAPVHLNQAFNGVLKAVKNGTISEKELDEHVKRILRMKLAYN